MMFLYRPHCKHQASPPVGLFLLVRSAAIPAKVGSRATAAGGNGNRSSSYKGIGNGEYLCAK